MATAKLQLIVSLHDAHPGSRERIANQVRFLSAYGIEKSSILVVPEFHHGRSIAQDTGFAEQLRIWQDHGHELVLHGYFHDRIGSPAESWQTLFWTRFYTQQEAEFLDLPLVEARKRLELGRALLQKLGWTGNGFVAPAWLMTQDLPDLLEQMKFGYTTRRTEIIPLGPGSGRKVSSSLCYSTRAGWRRVASGIWNKRLYARLRTTDLVRLSLHPDDLAFPLVRRQIDQILRAALKAGFVSTTYGEYVAR